MAMANRRRLRIASYNINGINSRLHVLTRWLEEFEPDIVGLQELKCTDEAFPREAIEALGYSAIWHGQQQLERRRDAEPRRRAGRDAARAARTIPTSSRAAISRQRCAGSWSATCMRPTAIRGRARNSTTSSRGWIAERSRAGAARQQLPAILIGDFNVIPTDQDVYKPERWLKDALFAPEAREQVSRDLVAQGWTDAIRTPPPRRAHLHLLALLAERVRARRRHPHRPRAAQPAPGEKAQGRGRRPHPARLGQDQRPRTDVGRGRGLKHAATR